MIRSERLVPERPLGVRTPAASDSLQAHEVISARFPVWSRRVLLLIAVVALGSGLLRAQAAVEYSGAVSKSGGAAVSAPRVAPPGDTANPANFVHLPARTGPAAEELNRRALEAHAGKDAAKLMLRSLPNKSAVRINGKVVGKTPVLLILAPGAYKIEMEGDRMSSAEKQVDLLPHETREVTMALESRYPVRVQLK
jgi:hypothetical protein